MTINKTEENWSKGLNKQQRAEFKSFVYVVQNRVATFLGKKGMS